MINLEIRKHNEEVINSLFRDGMYQYPEYKISYQNLTKDMLPEKLKSSNSFDDFEVEMQELLFLWIRNANTFKVLWQINEAENELVIFQNSCLILADKLSKELIEDVSNYQELVECMIVTLGMAHYFLEKFIFKNKWLLKERNKEVNGVCKLFIIWITSVMLNRDRKLLSCLFQFDGMLVRGFNFYEYHGISNEIMKDAFLKCFTYESTDLWAFDRVLESKGIKR